MSTEPTLDLAALRAEVQAMSRYYGDWRGLYDSAQMFAHVRLLTGALPLLLDRVAELEHEVFALTNSEDGRAVMLEHERDEATRLIAWGAEQVTNAQAETTEEVRKRELAEHERDLAARQREEAWRELPYETRRSLRSRWNRAPVVADAPAGGVVPEAFKRAVTATVAERYPHAVCGELRVHAPHTWGDPAHFCDGRTLPAVASTGEQAAPTASCCEDHEPACQAQEKRLYACCNRCPAWREAAVPGASAEPEQEAGR